MCSRIFTGRKPVDTSHIANSYSWEPKRPLLPTPHSCGSPAIQKSNFRGIRWFVHHSYDFQDHHTSPSDRDIARVPHESRTRFQTRKGTTTRTQCGFYPGVNFGLYTQASDGPRIIMLWPLVTNSADPKRYPKRVVTHSRISWRTVTIQ